MHVMASVSVTVKRAKGEGKKMLHCARVCDLLSHCYALSLALTYALRGSGRLWYMLKNFTLMNKTPYCT